MLHYEIENDFTDRRQDYLKFLLIATAGIGLVLFAFNENSSTGVGFLAPWLIIAAALMVSFGLMRKQKTHLSVWAYLMGLLVACGISLYEFGPSTAIYFLLVLPIVLATLLLEREQVTWLSTLAIGIIYLITAANTNLIAAAGLTATPIIFVVILTVANESIMADVQERVFWALDIQRKDSTRAETFFEQKEQLSEALRQLTHANSRLEILNVHLAEAEHKTAQASQAKSVFLSNMSHELRTPLNVIIGYSSTMLDMPGMYNSITLPTVYTNDIQLIKDSGYYLLGLINDILDLSKIEAGKLELHNVAVDLPELFNGILATSIGLIKDKPLQLRPDYSLDLPRVWADPTRVRQIILNLMSNAIKFTASGSVTLQAAVQGGRVAITVIDTGIGIPEKALAHIFDRFEQAEHDTDKQYGGTGLGLDISMRLAQMHGGELTVESQPGQGSTFTFTLPIVTEQQDRAHDGPKHINTSVVTLVPTDTPITRTVLVVEDEASLRDMMRRALESVNYLVVDIQDGALVMDTAIGLLPDLIILDIRLPNIDGWELLANLKHDPETSNIPVIVCTVSEDAERAHSLGAEVYLRKPFFADELVADVQGLLSGTFQANSDPI